MREHLARADSPAPIKALITLSMRASASPPIFRALGVLPSASQLAE